MDLCAHCLHPSSCHDGRCLVQVAGGAVCECGMVQARDPIVITTAQPTRLTMMHGDGRVIVLDRSQILGCWGTPPVSPG